MPFSKFKLVFVLLLLLIIINSTLIYLYITTKSVEPYNEQFLKSPIYCYQHKSNLLPSILKSNVPKNRSIFFHDTSCNCATSGKIIISSRQACAVESAARLNPNFKIYLLYTSPGTIKKEGTESDRFLQVLQSYENVKILLLDLGEYVEGTPVEDLWRKGLIENSYYVIWHASDVLRFVTLYKYGGIYLDLDVIVKKSLEDLPLNYAGVEAETSLCNAVLSFSSTNVGRALTSRCLEDLRDNFNGELWAHNGPGAITRLAKSLCGSETVGDLTGKTCSGVFKVYPVETFYPVPGDNWTMLFKENYVNKVEEMTKNSYVVHFWNDISYMMKIPVGMKVPYTLYAEKYCPGVYSQCDHFF